MGARKFTFAYDQSGAHMHETHSYPIDPTTNIGKAGTVVVLTNGKVAKAAKTAQAAILGITAQDHDGSSDGQKTSFIEVYDSPTAVFKCKPENCELVNDTAGAAAFVEGDLTGAADDQFNNGLLKLTKAPNVTVANPVTITDFTALTGTIAATLTGGVLVGDKAVIFPPLLSTAFALNTACNNLDMNSKAGTVFRVLRVDTTLDEVYVMAALHLLANKAS